MHAETIKNIRYLGNLETMDIEVDHEDHIYFGNGIAISNSHSYSYAYISYFQAYQKFFFPTEFYTAALTYADEKLDPKVEIAELVQDARLNNVLILNPDITRKNVDFEILEYRKICFGLSHIRNVGQSAIKNLEKLTLTSFIDFIKCAKKIKRNVSESLIKSGACDTYKLQRNYMLSVLYMILGRSDTDEEGSHLHFRSLTPNEYKCFMDNVNLGYIGALEKIIETEACIAKRIPVIESKIAYLQQNQDVKDTNKIKSIWEKIYLGINLSCSAADDVEKAEDVVSCKQVHKIIPEKVKYGHKRKLISLHVVIDELILKQTSEKAKNPGQDYCYLTVSDSTANLKFVTCWPETYDKYKEDLRTNAVCNIKGYKTSWNGKDQFIVEEIEFLD